MTIQNQTPGTTQPPIRFPVGVDDFKDLVTGNYRFADKTNFVRDIMEDGAKVILITRPRRFGKTLSMSMLSYFLGLGGPEDRALFDGLAISKNEAFCQQHQQQYPVIFVSFKSIKEPSYPESYAKVVTVIKNLYAEHRYLMDNEILAPEEKEEFWSILRKQATRDQIQNAIKQLSVYLKRKFGKSAIILIDEYDTPIQAAYMQKYYDEMIPLMRGILGEALKDNTSLHKAVLTGISRVSQESLFSGLNNLKVYSLLQEKYGQYFGFTEAEVLALSQGIELKSGFAEIKAWYNGYNIGGHTMYNPWSIIMCLDEKGDCRPYWLNTGGGDLITRLFAKVDAATRGHFELLLQGETIEKPLMEGLVFPELDFREDALWSLLLYAGYLNVISTRNDGFELMAKIAVPNHEVMHVYKEMVAGWFRRHTSLDSYKNFLKSLVSGNVETFKQLLGEYLMESGSYFDFNKRTSEQVFQAFMLGLVVGLKDDYIIDSNQEAGLGRLDVVFIPKDKNKNPVGILLEFKTALRSEDMMLKANEALDQIKDKQYIQLLKQHDVKETLAVGLSFCGKQVELASERVVLC